MSIYAIYAYYLFSSRGGNLQGKVHDLIVNSLKWDGNGTCLEIGCGSAPVAIKVAKKFSAAKVLATDYWGKTPFEYSEIQCAQNAKIEGVADRMEFKFANAMQLPFEDASFDAVICNLTFHEVNPTKKEEIFTSISEAFRVLKKGAPFAFQDLFQLKLVFGDFEQLKKKLASYVSEVHWIDSFSTLKIPHLLNNAMMLQGLGVFYGRK
jgi:ubiquinone/menaquinone biosynthesis C-methylase UbiE